MFGRRLLQEHSRVGECRESRLPCWNRIQREGPICHPNIHGLGHGKWRRRWRVWICRISCPLISADPRRQFLTLFWRNPFMKHPPWAGVRGGFPGFHVAVAVLKGSHPVRVPVTGQALHHPSGSATERHRPHGARRWYLERLQLWRLGIWQKPPMQYVICYSPTKSWLGALKAVSHRKKHDCYSQQKKCTTALQNHTKGVWKAGPLLKIHIYVELLHHLASFCVKALYRTSFYDSLCMCVTCGYKILYTVYIYIYRVY